MELFSIYTPVSVTDGTERLYGRLSRELESVHNLHSLPDTLQIKVETLSKFTVITCHSTSLTLSIERYLPAMYEKTAEILADYIINEFEMKLIRELIYKHDEFKPKDEIDAVEQYCRQFLNDDPFTFRSEKISEALARYLEESPTINLDGFIRFRLEAYLDELKEVVEYAVDEFLMDKQYQEFIALLKYLVYMQEAKIPLAHLVHKGNQFQLLNEQMKPFDLKSAGDATVLEKMDRDMGEEDLIVSTLITISPQRLYIHTRDPEAQVIHTIQQIFEGRTTLCAYCHQCQPIIDTERKLDKYLLDR